MKNPTGLTTKTMFYYSMGFVSTVYHDGKQYDGSPHDDRNKARREAIKEYLYLKEKANV